jgi:hypothetical protein
MRNKRLNGTVLIMVVAFMFILIVFCTATLAMVSTANSRAYNKFEENQSYYTAASALDVFATGTLSDAVVYAKTTGGQARDYVTKYGDTIQELTQGRALELDLYQLAVNKADTTLGSPHLGMGRLGDKGIFEGESAAVAVLENVINASTDDYFSDSDPAYAKQFMPNKNYRYAEYKMELPGVSSSGTALQDGDNFGLFSDSVIESGDKVYPVEIVVEVLDRFYNVKGVENAALMEYVNILARGGDTDDITPELAAKVAYILGPDTSTPGILDDTDPFDPAVSDTYDNISPFKLKQAIAEGSRSKDYFKIRVTSSASLMGITSKAVREFNVSPPIPEMNDNAITNMGYNRNGAEFISVGGSSSLVASDIRISGSAGPMFSAGTIEFAANGGNGNQISEASEVIDPNGSYLKPYLTSLDWITWNSNASIKYQGYNAAYYAYRGFYLPTSGVTIGGTSNPAHMVTPGKIVMDGSVTVYGNVVADMIEISNGTGLTVENVGSTGSEQYGNLYVKTVYEDMNPPGTRPENYNSWFNPINHLKVDGTIYTKDVRLRMSLAELQGAQPFYDVLIPGNINYTGNFITSDNVLLVAEVDGSVPTKLRLCELNGATTNAYVPLSTTHFPDTTYPTAAVCYFTDSNFDGNADYVFREDFRKEFTLPYTVYLNNGSTFGGQYGKLLVDTPQSHYSKYFGEKAVWGKGVIKDEFADGKIDNADYAFYNGVDLDSDGLCEIHDLNNDNIIEGGDGMLIGYKVTETSTEYIKYGILQRPTSDIEQPGDFLMPDTPVWWTETNTRKIDSGNIVGFDKNDITNFVASSAEYMKSKYDLGDGVKTAIFSPGEYATVDTTTNTWPISLNAITGSSTVAVTEEVSCTGVITSSGIFNDSYYCEPDKGSNVFIVNTIAGGDINLQLPLKARDDRDYIANVVFVVVGEGRFNIIIPDKPEDVVNIKRFVMGGTDSSNPFIAVHSNQYIMTGLKTSLGKFAGYDSSDFIFKTGNSVPEDERTGGSKITMFVGNGHNIFFMANSLFAGILYNPRGDVQIAELGPKTNTYYNDDRIPGPGSDLQVQIMGSLICGSFKTTNNNAVMYLPASVDRDDGTPHFTWIPTKFTPSYN